MILESFHKHITPATLLFGTAAGVIGLLLAKHPPFTYIAAAILIASVVLSIYQHYHKLQSDEKLRQDEKTARLMLRKLVFSIPLGEDEREEYRKLVYTEASKHGYDLRRVASWKSDDGWISSAMYFAKGDTTYQDETSDAAGIIVISPTDYAKYATVSEDDARAEIRNILFSPLPREPFDEALDRIGHAAKILVFIETEEPGRTVKIYRDAEKDTVAVVVGDTVAIADRSQFEELLQLPGLDRDRHILKLIHANAGLRHPSRAAG